MSTRVTLIIFFTSVALSLSAQQNEAWRQISGEPYDWKKTMVPERPYMIPYHQTQLMKIMLSMPDGKGGTKIKYTFEEVLSLIKRMDAISRGLPKVMFLVGWQYNGHDDKYPAWFQVNDALKRDCDGTGRESILWLAEEAKKYNTSISVHVNMTDAYTESPLWDEYMAKGLISRNEDGTPMQIGIWNDQKAFQICYKNEWESGYAVNRIERLLELLPFIKESGTIMIDAFFARPNPYEKISAQEEESYQRRIFRYFRNQGIDVTHESYRRLREGLDLFIGITPWYLWFDQTEKGYTEHPAYLASGGASYLFYKQFPKLTAEQLQLGFLFGMSGRGEDCVNNHNSDFDPRKDWEEMYSYQFYTGTLPYIYLNRYRRENLTGKGSDRVAYYNDNLVVSLKDSLITHDNRILRDGDDLFMPVLWGKEREIIAYSLNGYNKKCWELPPDWSDVVTIDLYKIETSGIRYISTHNVLNGKLELTLLKEEAYSVFPAKGQRRK